MAEAVERFRARDGLTELNVMVAVASAALGGNKRAVERLARRLTRMAGLDD